MEHIREETTMIMKLGDLLQKLKYPIVINLIPPACGMWPKIKGKHLSRLKMNLFSIKASVSESSDPHRLRNEKLARHWMTGYF